MLRFLTLGRGSWQNFLPRAVHSKNLFNQLTIFAGRKTNKFCPAAPAIQKIPDQQPYA
jgi:hypothetical protein